MNQLLRVDPPTKPPDQEADPYRYGWRYVRRTRPDGTEEFEQVPLSYEDVLYPEEGDFVMNNPVHLRDFAYCHGALETYYANQPGVVVLGDCRVDWGVEGVRPLGPDVLVLFDVSHWRRQATFHVAEEGGRPVLVVEITSPTTWGHDVDSKIALYFRAGVEKYVIVDCGPTGEEPVRLIGYQRGPTEWLPLPPDAQGRLSLAPVGLVLGLEDGRPWLYDAATSQRLPDLTESTRALADAGVKLQEEAQARAALEQRLRELEERLRSQNGHAENAENG